MSAPRLAKPGGGVGGHHPAYELQSVIVLDKTHPITAGVEDFDVHDEQHFTFIDEHRGYRHTDLPFRSAIFFASTRADRQVAADAQGAAAAQESRLEWP